MTGAESPARGRTGSGLPIGGTSLYNRALCRVRPSGNTGNGGYCLRRAGTANGPVCIAPGIPQESVAHGASPGAVARGLPIRTIKTEREA